MQLATEKRWIGCAILTPPPSLLAFFNEREREREREK